MWGKISIPTHAPNFHLFTFLFQKGAEHEYAHRGSQFWRRNLVGALHLVNEDPYYATVSCKSNCKVLSMKFQPFCDLLIKNPDINIDIVHSLSKSVRKLTKELQATPLLAQTPRRVENQFLVVSAAATIESFYRSSLNAWLNSQLSGKKLEIKHLFPNMQIQSKSKLPFTFFELHKM